MRRPAMREFWDERADEDPFFFVDNRLAYGDPDLERFWAGGELVVDRLLTLLGEELVPSDDVVEVGCGVGRLTRVLAARARSVRALDISSRMLELAREQNPDLDNVTWIQGDGATLTGVDDASASVCFSHVVFQHLPDPQLTLGYVREMGRALRPGGWAGFQVSNDPRPHRPGVRARLRAGARALGRRGPRGQASAAWLGSAVDLDELRTAAADGGLELERVVGAGTQFCLALARKRP